MTLYLSCTTRAWSEPRIVCGQRCLWVPSSSTTRTGTGSDSNKPPPPLVLVGGLAQTIASYESHLPLFSKERDVLVYECRGQGIAPAPDNQQEVGVCIVLCQNLHYTVQLPFTDIHFFFSFCNRMTFIPMSHYRIKQNDFWKLYRKSFRIHALTWLDFLLVLALPWQRHVWIRNVSYNDCILREWRRNEVFKVKWHCKHGRNFWPTTMYKDLLGRHCKRRIVRNFCMKIEGDCQCG